MKTAGNNKRKSLPKLKSILANPHKSKCPTLNDDELQELRQLFVKAIEECGSKDARTFIKEAQIRLGLESSLRAINNCQVSCVFLSLSIKPNHLISLIARNVEVTNRTVPVFALPVLEDFTEELFGVKALVLSLPSITDGLDTKLKAWINKHKKTPAIELPSVKIMKTKTPPKLAKSAMKRKLLKVQHKPMNISEKREEEKATPAAWSGDFISFSDTSVSSKVEHVEVSEDKTNLLGVLSKMTKKAEEGKESKITALPKETTELDESALMGEAVNESISDSDDFLETYQPLTIYKIRPNPDKKPSKKRKKTKKPKKNC